MAGYRVFRHDRDTFGGDLCIYVNKKKQLKSLNNDSKIIFSEITFV